MAEGEQVSRGGLRGIHVLAIFLGFFGVVFAVNGVFLYQALSTHTGVVSRQPYRKGLEYNSRIADAERQQKLGWRDDLSYRREAGVLVVKITDKGGSPVTGLYVSGIIGRPSTAQQDTTLVLSETQSGHYEAKVGARDDGNWLVQLKAEVGHGDKGQRETVYRLKRRLWLKH